jgi:hypothetical protein
MQSVSIAMSGTLQSGGRSHGIELRLIDMMPPAARMTEFDPQLVIRKHSLDSSALVTDWAMETWYHPSIA